MHTCTTTKKITDKLKNARFEDTDFLQLRLSQQERHFYTHRYLFLNYWYYEYSMNDTISRENFPSLMGLLGTDIALQFSQRIFDAFSSDKTTLKLNEYLKYIDVYHHGDERERCRITFQLMDKNTQGYVTLEDFEDYLQIIISAISKVHPGAKGKKD